MGEGPLAGQEFISRSVPETDLKGRKMVGKVRIKTLIASKVKAIAKEEIEAT